MKKVLKPERDVGIFRAGIAMFVIFMIFNSVVSGQKITRQSAVNAWTNKNYELAYRQFSELLDNFPGDPLYKYYCGSCLVELKREPLRAAALLSEAAYESGAIRSVPSDCFYYLGRAQQMSGKYSDAIQAFNRFASVMGKKAAKEFNVAEYIKQCSDQKGRILTEVTASDQFLPVNRKDSLPESKPAGIIADSLPVEYDRLLTSVLESRIKADSLLIIKKNTEQAVRPALDSTSLRIPVLTPAKDSAKVTNRGDSVKKEADTTVTGTPDYSEFMVNEKPTYKPTDKVAIDPVVPKGLIYRIQVAVFRNPVSPSYFKGISPIQGFRNPVSGIATYYAGRFRRSADAEKALLKVRAKGFRDAFVVALLDKKAVSNDRAALLEKAWGSKPLFTQMPSAGTPKDTVPPTLIFRVEVKRSAKPLPGDQVEAIRKMSVGKGFDIITPEPKQYIYLVGKFLSFTSAAEFADLLVRNGYKEARVVAWLGEKEIPVETARQLFEQQ